MIKAPDRTAHRGFRFAMWLKKITFGSLNHIKPTEAGRKLLRKEELYPLLRLMGHANSMKEVALSMLTLTRDGYEKFAIDPKDTTILAKRF